jgi:hypothetical protein
MTRRRRLFPLYAHVHASSGPPPSPPVNTVAPVLSFAGSDNSVGVQATVTDGTWTGSPTFVRDWRTVSGGSLGAPDLATYTPTSALAGLALFCRIAGTNGGGSVNADSNTITVKPYWTANPVIDGEPWPGGTVDSTQGTVLGSTSTTYAWRVNGTPNGQTGAASVVPALAEYTGTLTQLGTGNNAGGATVGTASNGLTLERVAGILRADIADDYATAASITIPTNGCVWLEFVGFAIEATASMLFSCGGGTTGAGCRGIEVAIDNAFSPGNLHIRGSVREGTNTTFVRVACSNALDGVTRFMVGYSWSASETRIALMIPGGATTTADASDTHRVPTGGNGTRVPTLFERAAQLASIAGISATVATAAILECAVTTESGLVAVSAFEAVAAAGSLRAGLSMAGALVSAYPTPGAEVDGGTIDAGSDLASSTWTLTAGTTLMEAGGLNVPV